MIWGLAFSPDGRRLVTSCDDGRIRWWDVATGQPSGRTLQHGCEQGYYTLALSPDARTLVTGGNDKRVIRWDVETGTEIGTPIYFNSGFTCSHFSGMAAGLSLARATAGLQSGAPKLADVRPPSQGTSVTGLAVSPNGKTFATGTDGRRPPPLGHVVPEPDRGHLRVRRRRDRARPSTPTAEPWRSVRTTERSAW